ncbi:transcription initiation factor TFIID subunit 8 [Strongylocentrotus purpuratus]|uniref:Transcription initiation factor TFIID subunit 8 n=1 Tax=Strongylocentrotus purpuratus TaxID=7668 RepID=A0A7M7PCM2_STRPU|nr:transcription initiation factor TFIID subunit 8 [Strongylocentrotus purpuratus]|eukprot:XP_797171.1 PREDICTED: transcription initiation factor TFIID subunit 8 [Strongylocentrotus purpuratus]
MTSTDNSQLAASHRRALLVAVAATCSEAGFTTGDEDCLETLAEIMQSYITELGQSSRAYCELACRSLPMVTDIGMAMSQSGVDASELKQFARRKNKIIIPKQDRLRPTSDPSGLQVGQRNKHPSYIYDHLPAFPDSHTYIQTPTFKPQDNDYKTVREKAASQRRDVERALTRFIAKTGDNQTLFPGDSNLFPLIACTPSPVPYLDALIPSEHDVLEEPEENQTLEGDMKSADESEEKRDSGDAEGKPKGTEDDGGSTPAKRRHDPEVIDNPFLREPKRPRYKKKK